MRSLALKLRQPLLNLTRSFVNYVNCGVMSFVEVQQEPEHKVGNNGDSMGKPTAKMDFYLIESPYLPLSIISP